MPIAGSVMLIAAASVVFILILIGARAGMRSSAGRLKPAAAAESLGMAYQKSADGEFRKAWHALPDTPKHGKTQHVLFGIVRDVEVTAFQHTTTTMAGSTPIVIVKSVYSCPVPGWPDLEIRRRGALGRWMFGFGTAGGVRTGDVRFDREWQATSEDRRFLEELLSSDRLRAFITGKQSVKWRVVKGRLCLIYQGSLRGDRVGTSIDRLLGFLEATPADAWEQR